MRTVYLLRHAKSSWGDETLDDHDRPLAPRGREATPLMAGHMRQAGVTPQVVLCSSARRTRETLELLGDAVPADCDVRIEEDLYGASAASLLERLRGLSRGTDRVMLIGHNPGLQDLALLLAVRGRRLDELAGKYPTAALATLDAAIEDWSGLDRDCGELVGFVRPKDLSGP